jgi:hypothetical protein
VTGSRLARDNHNRLLCVDTAGHVWLVLDLITVLGFTKRGRPPTAQERTSARPPYSSVRPKPPAPTVDDELLDERAALEAARLGQQGRPADLIGRAA